MTCPKCGLRDLRWITAKHALCRGCKSLYIQREPRSPMLAHVVDPDAYALACVLEVRMRSFDRLLRLCHTLRDAAKARGQEEVSQDG